MAAKEKSPDKPDTAPRRILLVDDDAEIIESLKYALSAKGHEILVARDGNQGLAMAEQDDPDLVIISRPVTYWDRLGWRDTLAREENTQLQRHYAETLSRGGGRSYTPQAVVGGRIGLVGSRRGELEAAIAEISGEPSDISIEMEGDPENGFRLSVNGAAESPAIVRLLALDSSETVRIGRGENGGRSVTYTNILRHEQDIAQYRGTGLEIEISEELLRVEDSDRYAIVVRSEGNGHILAARYLGS